MLQGFSAAALPKLIRSSPCMSFIVDVVFHGDRLPSAIAYEPVFESKGPGVCGRIIGVLPCRGTYTPAGSRWQVTQPGCDALRSGPRAL